MNNLQRKAIQTWLTGTHGLFLLMLVTGHARRDTFEDGIYANSNTDVCRRRHLVDVESVL